jgi:hypothetical protein
MKGKVRVLVSSIIVHSVDYAYQKDTFLAGENGILTWVNIIITQYNLNYKLYPFTSPLKETVNILKFHCC